MRTIVKGKEPIVSLWCAPSVQSGIYRMMKYHVKTECDEGELVLNTVTGELVLLSTKEDQLLKSLPKTYEPDMDELIAHRFLVPEAYDELISMIQLRRVIRSLEFSRNEVTTYTILPTTTCNARCFYCYENEYPHFSMSDETAEQLIDYIETHCGKTKAVRLSWFGGEPTLGEKHIDYVCESLRQRNISFSSSMVSNGYLFTREMAHKAKEKWQLRNIQVTLDGTEEVYNNVKAYVNPKANPFRKVIDNIGFLLDEKVRVAVRLNLDLHNTEDLKELINQLTERFLDDDCFSVYVHELFEGMGYEPIQRSEKQLQAIIEIKQAIETYIDSKGLRQSAKDVVKALPHLKPSFCMADNPTSVMINPEGKLGKCQHVQFSHLVGELKNEKSMCQEELLYWFTYSPLKGCKYCPLCPFCGVPQTCESGRTCVSTELNQKLDVTRKLCRASYTGKSD